VNDKTKVNYKVESEVDAIETQSAGAIQSIPEHQMPQQSQSVHPSALINAYMAKPDVDIEKLEQLFELQTKYEAHEAKKSFNRAMARFREICPAIKNDKRVNFEAKNGGAATDYRYAGLAATIETVKSAMAECGLSHSWRPVQKDDQLHVTCYITHALGHSIEATMSSGRDTSGNKNNIQALKSTKSYLERMTFQALLGLATDSDDDDGRGSEAEIQPPAPLVSRDQAANLQALHDEVGGDTSPILNFFKASDWSGIPAESYHAVVQKLEARRNADN
jgi:hypothetical protein